MGWDESDESLRPGQSCNEHTETTNRENARKPRPCLAPRRRTVSLFLLPSSLPPRPVPLGRMACGTQHAPNSDDVEGLLHPHPHLLKHS